MPREIGPQSDVSMMRPEAVPIWRVYVAVAIWDAVSATCTVMLVLYEDSDVTPVNSPLELNEMPVGSDGPPIRLHV